MCYVMLEISLEETKGPNDTKFGVLMDYLITCPMRLHYAILTTMKKLWPFFFFV